MQINKETEKIFNEYLKNPHNGIYEDPLGVIAKKEYMIEQQKYLDKISSDK